MLSNVNGRNQGNYGARGQKYGECQATSPLSGPCDFPNSESELFFSYHLCTLTCSCPVFCPSLYSLPPSSLMISCICTGILSIQACIFSCGISFQHLTHAFLSSFSFVIGPFFVVSLFIQYQASSIAFRSGELAGQ